jgi:ABC-type polysaccharide/polyol phosphate transport system ATPase subunit
MSNIAIKIVNLTKTYKIYKSPQYRLFEALHPFRKKYHSEFHAIKNINIEIEKGEVIGIIGNNGAGKSTLLKILSGVLTPTSGNYIANGKISALLELGTGFNPEYTGMQNIYFRSSLMGYKKEQIDNMIDDIVDFAEIGEHIDQPVKTYSSGMFVRLAFAVAVNVNPDILIIDEALSVGDAFFAAKSMNRINKFKDDGKTVLFVSHSQNSIINLCSRAILIDNGILTDVGIPKEIIKIYNNQVYKRLNSSNLLEDKSNKVSKEEPKKNGFKSNDFQTEHIKLLSCRLINENDEEIKMINVGENLLLRYEVIANKDFQNITFGFSIRNNMGAVVFGTNSYLLKKNFSLKKNTQTEITFSVPVDFSEGVYSIAVSAANQSYHINSSNQVLMFKYEVITFKVNSNINLPYYEGYVYLNAKVDIK